MTEPNSEQALERAKGGVTRLFTLDALRGLIIVLMALDHANLLVAQKHPASEMWGGAFPVYYDTLAFLTRFVTHLCAPGFFFLMGVGMVLLARARGERGWSRWQVIRHFLIRGGALIALKFLVVNRAWELSPAGWGIRIYIGVLFALGATMILGSLLLWLKTTYLVGLTVVLVIGNALLVPDPSLWGPGTSAPALLLLVPGGIVDSGGGTLLWSNYPVLPWLEFATLGMAFANGLATDPRRAYGRAWKLGLGFLAAFLVVRYLDGFGNIRPRLGNTVFDFLTPVKYPPSIAFMLLTMGANLIILSLFARLRQGTQKLFQSLVVFGRAPLFFYVLHIFLYAGLGHLVAPRGTTIPIMYVFWLLGLLILFPLCLWYGRLKHRQPAGSFLRLL